MTMEHMEMKAIVIALILGLSACATVKTLPPSTTHVDIEYEGKRSYCDSIPRVYSGVAYNLCTLFGEPNPRANINTTMHTIPLFMLDSGLCLVTDTLALPYTIYTQNKHGSIDVN